MTKTLSRSGSILVGLALLASSVAGAHEFFSTKITWTREVSRVLAKRCLGCHQAGGSGKAFSLATYAEARPWAKAIKEEVLNRRMPPWGAAKGFGSFANDQGLSQDEIGLLADWVEGGAPEGDRAFLPANLGIPALQFSAYRIGPSRRRQMTELLGEAVRLQSIVPQREVARDTQVTAVLPDGTVEPLLWVVEPKSAVGREFLFRIPILLPRSTKFVISGEKPQNGRFPFLLIVER